MRNLLPPRTTLAALSLLLVIAAAPAVAQAPSSPQAPTPAIAAASPTQAAPLVWTRKIDALVEGRGVSVAIGSEGSFLYRFKSSTRRAPASNEKLLLSMALLDAMGPDHIIRTSASAEDFSDGVVHGDLWIIGGGDPEVTGARMRDLARELRRVGLTEVEGSVLGSISVFKHDWWAPGWKSYFPSQEVALPSALSFNRNTAGGRHISDPEARAATSLTRALRKKGVKVAGKPGVGKAPAGLPEVAGLDSSPLIGLLRRMNVPSDNWYAETLGKLLGAEVLGRPGTISKGAQAIDQFTEGIGAPSIRPSDSSGLSYDDRVTAGDMLRSIWFCEEQPWLADLRRALPTAGQGTLSDRLKGVAVRAKTGTLTGISALSGWVRSEKSRRWIGFSIVSRGMSKSTASHIEDRIVTIIANRAA